LIRIRVAASATFGRRGNDLTLTVPVSYTEAALGTKIEVPTLNGAVKVKIPGGTPTGKTFRVKGRGISPESGRPGDLLVTVQVTVPAKVTKKEREILEQLSEVETKDLRSHLG
jgi:molecular chaperone DnaJ